MRRSYTSRRRKPSISTMVAFFMMALYGCGSRVRQHHQNSLQSRLQASTNRRRGLHFAIFAEATAQNDIPESELPRPINYYELLDLESPDMHRRPRTNALHNRKKRSNFRARITNDQIKKAYRKQAQLYHPDKLAARKLKQEMRNGTNSNVTIVKENDPLANMTIEEATSLFAKIAEAYQVLIDPAQRYEYDWELLEMEDEYEEERMLLSQQRNNDQGRRSRGTTQGTQPSYSGTDSFSLYEAMKSGASNFNSWKDYLNLDPWAVFEDFFFQESTVRNDQGSNQEFYSSEQAYGNKRYHQSQTTQMKPPRVSEQTIYRGFDPSYGANIYTVLRREDYIHDERDSDGKYFYQILGQDFISGTQVDPFTGFTLREYYSAVTEPYLVEKGYSNKNDEYVTRDNNARERRSPHKQRNSIHKLEQGESITPNRSHAANQWISPNGEYEAVLSSTCELQILKTSAVVWSTETYIPHTRAKGCNLALNDLGQLVLSVDYGSGLGSVTDNNTVLWSSPLPKVVPHLFHAENGEESITFHYYSSLDNDGIIAVYRIQANDINEGSSKNNTTRSTKTKTASSRQHECNDKKFRTGQHSARIMPKIVKRLSLMYHRLSKTSIEQKKTKAALAWDSVRYKVVRVLKSRPAMAGDSGNRLSSRPDGLKDGKDEGTNSQSKNEARAECIYSTSPAGCLTSGRNAIYLTRKLVTVTKSSLLALDSKIDDFFSHLTEPADDYESFIYDEDYDDDILDTLIRVTGAASAKGIQLGKAGVHAAQIGLEHGKRAAGKVVGKMKDRVGKQSVKWNERTEEDDVGSFF